MPAGFDRQLELGSDAVIGRDQQRIAIAGRLEVEEAAEAAERGVGARPRGRPGQRRDRPDQRIAGGDRDARLGVSVAVALAHRRRLVPVPTILKPFIPRRRSGPRPLGGARAGSRPSPGSTSRLDFHAQVAKRRCVKLTGRLPLLIVALLASLLAGRAVWAQLEGADRGVPPIDSASTFEIGGIEVDVTADTAEKAREEGWRQAQQKGWKALWAKTNGRPDRAGAGPDRFGAERPRLRDRRRAGADRPEALYRHPRHPLRPRPHRPAARGERLCPTLRADARHPGDADRLLLPELRVAQPVAAGLGPLPHRQQPGRLCPADRLRNRSAAAQRHPEPAARAAAGGGCCSTNMAPPT